MMCMYEGRTVTPEMPGHCSRCSLYLNTCTPVVRGGYLAGAECGCDDYCQCCPHYADCGMFFPMERSADYVVTAY